MGYQFRTRETFSAGFRRIVTHELKLAVNGLRTSPEDPATVHDARKRFKKTRALLRLFRSELGRKAYRDANVLLRDAGRDLAGLRDAHVLSETLEALSARFPGETDREAFDRARGALQARQQRMTADSNRLTEAVAATLATFEAEVAGWTVGDGWSAAAPNLERTYRRGRKAFRHAYRQPSDEGFHEWRKDVKNLWYHLRVLEPLWPGVITGLAAQAGRLADLLGAEHDLAVLVQTLAAEPKAFGGRKKVHGLRELTERRREELRVEAHLLGRRLYADEPERFAARLGAYWRAWREEAKGELAASSPRN